MKSRALDRRRHIKLATYVSISLTLMLLCHYLFDLDQAQAVTYAVGVYFGLLLLNFRVILSHTRTD